MCLLSASDDGGLRAVLDASETASRELIAIGSRRNDTTSESDSNNRGSVNLSTLTSRELKRAVSPLLRKMEEIDAASLLSLHPSRVDGGARLDREGERTVPPIHDDIVPSYHHRTDDTRRSIVRYLHVKELPRKYSAGVFVFPPGAEIPLHDHPGMVVLSRVLYGELRVLSYNVVSSAPEEEANDASRLETTTKEKETPTSSIEEAHPVRRSVFRSSVKAIKDFLLSHSFRDEDYSSATQEGSENSDGSYPRRDGGNHESTNNNNRLRAEINPSPMNVDGNDVLSAPHVTCLYPREGNCHSFVAGPHGAAVLDVSVIHDDSFSIFEISSMKSKF